MLTRLAETDFSSLVRVLKTDEGKRVAYTEVVEKGGVPGRPEMTVSRVQPTVGGFVSIPRLERHPHTTQTFVPLSVSRWLVVAAPSNEKGEPDLVRLKAAVASAGDAICLMRNVWHATVTVLDAPTEMIMMMWRSDAGEDTILYELDEPLRFAV
jgi:ureidoglycolate lyase